MKVSNNFFNRGKKQVGKACSHNLRKCCCLFFFPLDEVSQSKTSLDLCKISGKAFLEMGIHHDLFFRSLGR